MPGGCHALRTFGQSSNNVRPHITSRDSRRNCEGILRLERGFVGLLRSMLSGFLLRHVLSTFLVLVLSASWIGAIASSPRLSAQTVPELASPRILAHKSVMPLNVEPKVIVIGFLGGFVHRNERHHPEVKLIRELRLEYPTGAYFGLFENDNINEAYAAIVKQLDLHAGKPATEKNGQQAQILLFGHSWGASAVVRLARKLDRAGIPIALTIQVDSIAKFFLNDSVIPGNVAEAVNFYQTQGMIHGASLITAAEPARTKIVGNFPRYYETEPASCHDFSWYSRLFTRGHIEIECDPNLWDQVKIMLTHYLPDTHVAQNQPEATKAPTSGH